MSPHALNRELVADNTRNLKEQLQDVTEADHNTTDIIKRTGLPCWLLEHDGRCLQVD